MVTAAPLPQCPPPHRPPACLVAPGKGDRRQRRKGREGDCGQCREQVARRPGCAGTKTRFMPAGGARAGPGASGGGQSLSRTWARAANSISLECRVLSRAPLILVKKTNLIVGPAARSRALGGGAIRLGACSVLLSWRGSMGGSAGPGRWGPAGPRAEALLSACGVGWHVLQVAGSDGRVTGSLLSWS